MHVVYRACGPSRRGPSHGPPRAGGRLAKREAGPLGCRRPGPAYTCAWVHARKTLCAAAAGCCTICAAGRKRHQGCSASPRRARAGCGGSGHQTGSWGPGHHSSSGTSNDSSSSSSSAGRGAPVAPSHEAAGPSAPPRGHQAKGLAALVVAGRQKPALRLVAVLHLVVPVLAVLLGRIPPQDHLRPRVPLHIVCGSKESAHAQTHG